MNTNSDTSEYGLLFYNESKVVGISSFSATLEQARDAANVIANASGKELPNAGQFDEIGFMKTIDINAILALASEEFNGV
ncbi:hypothetical protein UFOVP573_28 [uncultured Caudovirales phage]|uniref:Uncharacterized protein n=1 Tax=uncultured Caudovirales phage TaxID=2100421 RepID=A0A6J5PUF9_9CAUD|nr:hypothetical protein UFOVP288_87 [uncultured Caudovirales phage]CAB4146147.1 hypothetical protein UFOVP483_109 [uncultured Caudovirales phage]CAB4150731.1 hypothetical protein UFOVP573_28 [uncultured Caudovirales phage]CAB4161573.1 hypothetical protein UFOVP769_87 [uncultured Caudovirales phage]CAB4174497.1 hypothetical protein UFOVP962_55 [uncultured Caudovirales phage]